MIAEEFDAAYISIGAHTHKTIGVEGEYSKGVIPAVEILRGIGDDSMPDFNNKAVVVIGGGNVAMDVARTAKRLGASEVKIVYRRLLLKLRATVRAAFVHCGFSRRSQGKLTDQVVQDRRRQAHRKNVSRVISSFLPSGRASSRRDSRNMVSLS